MRVLSIITFAVSILFVNVFAISVKPPVCNMLVPCPAGQEICKTECACCPKVPKPIDCALITRCAAGFIPCTLQNGQCACCVDPNPCASQYTICPFNSFLCLPRGSDTCQCCKNPPISCAAIQCLSGSSLCFDDDGNCRCCGPTEA